MTGWAKANEGTTHPRQTLTTMLPNRFMFIICRSVLQSDVSDCFGQKNFWLILLCFSFVLTGFVCCSHPLSAIGDRKPRQHFSVFGHHDPSARSSSASRNEIARMGGPWRINQGYWRGFSTAASGLKQGKNDE
jgi:hypothetical protein